MRPLIIATANGGKLRELRELLAGMPLAVTSLADHFSPLPEIPETGATFLDNALQKAAWVRQRMADRWVLADDSGLEVDALGGRPGVLSARFAGVHADSEANSRLLLELLAGVGEPRRTARFKCTAVLVVSAAQWYSAEGACEGTIADAPRGSEGFGYDPLFIPAGFDRTFGEMTSAEKHPLSHRGIALRKMRAIIGELCAGESADEDVSAPGGQGSPSTPPLSIGTLASGLAHALNNPLCAVAGFSSALLARLKGGEAIDPAELTSYLQVIHDEAFRCRDIIDHLQRFGRLQHNGAGSDDNR
jgi:XTP/dITP diphosphohydrolase